MSIGPFKRMCALITTIVLLAQVLLVLPVPYVNGAQSRASPFMAWDGPFNVTDDWDGIRDVDMAMDSKGDLHYVWVNLSKEIFYCKSDQDGLLLAGPRSLGTTNQTDIAKPHLSIDSNDQVHITWANVTVLPYDRAFEYVRLDIDGKVIAAKHGSGGDDILGYGTSFLTIRFYRDTTAPSTHGPITMQLYDNLGNMQKDFTVGNNSNQYQHADLALNPNGKVFLAYFMNRSVMNLTVVNNGIIEVNQTPLVQNGVDIQRFPELLIDSSSNVHLLWNEYYYGGGYDGYPLYHMKFDGSGTVLMNKAAFDLDLPITYNVMLLHHYRNKICSNLSVIVEVGPSKGSGGGPIPPPVSSLLVFNGNGEPTYFQEGFTDQIYDGAAVVQGGEQEIFMSWGQFPAGGGGGGQGTKAGHLYLFRSHGMRTIDISLKEEDMAFPDQIFSGEEFALNITVRNLGDWYTSDFFVNLTDMSTGDLVMNESLNLGPGPTGPGSNSTVQFLLVLTAPVTYEIKADPFKNPDDNLSNNVVELTLTPRSRPDLSIQRDNISFSQTRPDIGQNVEVTAQIINTGGLNATAEVTFYDGEDGILIGKTEIVSNSAATITSIFWKPMHTGVRTVVVSIGNITPTEPAGAAANNKANRTILVGSPNVPSIEITSPAPGQGFLPGLINITGKAWDLDGCNLTVFVTVDGKAWEEAVTRCNNSIKGRDWYIQWDLSDAKLGNHTVSTEVKDDIHENQTSVMFKLVPYLVPFNIYDWTPKNDPKINETEGVNFAVFVDQFPGLNLSYDWTVDGFPVGTNRTYNLTSGYNDAGKFTVVVTVRFEGYYRSHTWNLTILDMNRAPVKVQVSPNETYKLLRHQTDITFSILATDADNDVLNYTWTCVGAELNVSGEKATVRFKEDGIYYVNVTVSDGKGGKVNHTWTVEVLNSPPPCCIQPHDEGTWIENAVWVILVIIGVVVLVSIAVIYRRMTLAERAAKAEKEQKKAEGKTDEKSNIDEPDGMTPPGRMV